jgi:hypothetical protein
MPKAKSRQFKLTTLPYASSPSVIIEPRITFLNLNRILLVLADPLTAKTARDLLQKPLWVNYDTRIKEQLVPEITVTENKLLLEFYSLTDLVTIKQHFDIIFTQTFPSTWTWSYELTAGCR